MFVKRQIQESRAVSRKISMLCNQQYADESNTSIPKSAKSSLLAHFAFLKCTNVQSINTDSVSG